MIVKKLLFLFFCSLFFTTVNSQINRSFYTHELSFTVGPYQLRGDYGERKNFENNLANQGVSIGVNYYYNSSTSRMASYFENHFKPKLNFTFTSVSLEHIGYDGDPRLDNMTGSSTNFRFGVGMEWFTKEISFVKDDLYSTFHPNNIYPYAGFNVGINFSMPDAESSLEGGLDNPDNIFPTFVSTNEETGINLENNTNFYYSFQGGLRFKIKDNQDLILESNWAFFDTDFVDGLSPSGPQNKNNDWSWGINIGYAYTFR